jgi:hypothetical protein
MEVNRVVKIVYLDCDWKVLNTKRVDVTKNSTVFSYSKLLELVINAAPVREGTNFRGDVFLSYDDNEGDKVSISNDDDVVAAINYYRVQRSTTEMYLKIYVSTSPRRDTVFHKSGGGGTISGLYFYLIWL